MQWNDHSRDVPEGAHAFLSASKYHWISYDLDKLRAVYENFRAAQKGTELHRIAKDLIVNRIKLPRSKQTLNMYVNDAIGYRMTPEQPLLYSENCFGTADAIMFDESKGFLRIHDLKTGVTPASMRQLEIYMSLFCLEYGRVEGFKPNDISAELRIYQNGEVMVETPDPNDIIDISNKIVAFDKEIRKMKGASYGK